MSKLSEEILKDSNMRKVFERCKKGGISYTDSLELMLLSMLKIKDDLLQERIREAMGDPIEIFKGIE